MSYIKALMITAMLSVAAWAGKPYLNYNFTVVDENGDAITSGLNATIYNTSDSSVTIKADGQGVGAKTNPIYFTTNGLVSFWTKETSINVIVADTPTVTRSIKWSSLARTKHRLVFPKLFHTSDGNVIADDSIDTDSIDWGSSTGQIGFHSLATVTVVSDSTTITTTDMGKIYISTKTTPASFTLPYSSNTIDNGCVMIKNTGGANIYSVIPSGTDQIDVAGAGTAYDGIDGDNDFVVLYNDKGAAGSAGNWYILGKNGSQ